MAKRQRHSRFAAGLAVASALLPCPVSAGNFTVDAGETVSDPQLLDAPGDRGHIVAGGLLLVTGDTAITAIVDGTAINNAGRVVSDADALALLGAARVFNSGAIEAEGFAITGSDLSSIVNTGTISGGFAGIAVMDGNRITNGGSVSGEQGLSTGVGNSVVNAGTIIGGFDGVGLGDGNTLINTGLIEGRAFDALRADSGNIIGNAGTLRGSLTGLSVMDANVITNTSLIAAGGRGLVAGSGNTVDNHGMLAGGEAAVEFTGTGNSLNLHAGSRLEGLLLLGSGNRLNVGPGLNAALTFDGTPEIGTSGAPAVSADGMLAVVDPSLFSEGPVLLGELTRLLADAAGQRLSTQGVGSATWASGFGSARAEASIEAQVGGGLLGLDGTLAPGLRGGGFIGSAFTRADAGSGNMTGEDYVAGAYLGVTRGNTAVALSLAGGITHRNSQRTVLNNMAAGGIEQAEGDELGLYLSPAASLSTAVPLGGGFIIPGLRLRYAGLFLAGYEEQGSAASLELDSRSLHVLEARAEIAYALPPFPLGEGSVETAVRFGADATSSGGAPVEAEVLGHHLTLVDPGRDPVLRGFAGVDLGYAMASGSAFFFAAEAARDSASGPSAQVSAGVQWRF
jgi:hypothetical protein